VLVGHSLGAATAAILALALRSKYPTLHCYGYGMPAGVYDRKTASESREYVTSLVLDCDLVSRLSVQAMTRLREEVLDSIARARVHKLMIFQAMFKDHSANTVMYPPGDAPDSVFKRSLEIYKETVNSRRVAEAEAGLKPNLVIPGRVIHLVKSEEDTGFCSPKPLYNPQYAPSSDFLELVVSPNMAFDHFPDRYLIEFTQLWESWQKPSVT
jgi:pimeloyl-ACP methyl ester carboxylesterase